MFILIRLTQHVSGNIMPIIRITDYVNNCMWSMPGCVGCSRAELGHELCALCESWYKTAVVYCSQHKQAYFTCSCLHSLFYWLWA